VRAGSRRQFRGGLFPIDLSVNVDVDITVLFSIITIVSIVCLVNTDIIACLRISLQIRVHIVLSMSLNLILILFMVMVLLIPIHLCLLLSPIRLDIDRDALFPQRIHRVRQRLVRIDLFWVFVLVVLRCVIWVRVYRCIFVVLVFVYVGVDVVMMVIRGLLEMLQCLYHHTEIALNSNH
jgi:hypothetical protein